MSINKKINYQIWKVQHLQQSQMHPRRIQASVQNNQYGRPFKHPQPNPQLRRGQLQQSFPNKQFVRKSQFQSRIRQPQPNQQQKIRPSLTNRQLRNQIRPALTNQQLRNQVRPALTNQQLRNQVRPALTNQQLRNQVRPALTNQQLRNQVRPALTNQQLRNQVRPALTNQQLRNRVKPPRPNPIIKSRTRQEITVNRKKFFTPHDILLLAPLQDKAMWEVIIKRLPSDYSIPDREFIHIYESFRNRKK